MQAVTFFFAFVAVLALIGVAAWLVRRFAGNRLGANPNRGRMPRLAVIDAAAVDGRRRCRNGAASVTSATILWRASRRSRSVSVRNRAKNHVKNRAKNHAKSHGASHGASR